MADKEVKKRRKRGSLHNPENTANLTPAELKAARDAMYKHLSDDVIHGICMKILEDKTLTVACKEMGVGRQNFLHQIIKPINKDWFETYMEARRAQALGWVDELIEISEGKAEYWNGENPAERITRDTLRFRARQWVISRMLPRIFGDRVNQDVNVEGGNPIELKMLIESPKQETFEEFTARKERERCLPMKLVRPA